MAKTSHRMLSVSALLTLTLLLSCKTPGGKPFAEAAKTPELYFYTVLPKQLFARGEIVVIELQLFSRLEQPLLVSRTLDDEFVRFKSVGPDGKEVPWQGRSQGTLKEHLPSDFTVLGQYKETSAKRTISLTNGTGFAFDKPGEYSLTAEFAMGSPGRFAPFEGLAKAPVGSFHSEIKFCIEACTFEPLDVRNDPPQAAVKAVHTFYTHITRYRQLSIPHGRERKAIGPLLSQRLARELDSLQACDDDYYRRYGDFLRTNNYKPGSPWLEDGLFTGPDDAATPDNFRIISSRAVGDDRVDVLVAFKEDWGDSYGYITAILEDRRWVIDDYTTMYSNDDLQPLSAGHPNCKGGQWMGKGP